MVPRGPLLGHISLHHSKKTGSLLTTLLTPKVWALSTATTSPTLCGHQWDVLQFNSILTLPGVSTDPQVKGSVPQDCPPLQVPIANSGFPGHPHFCPACP